MLDKHGDQLALNMTMTKDCSSTGTQFVLTAPILSLSLRRKPSLSLV